EVINELGQTLFERAKLERGDKMQQQQFLAQAAEKFKKTLELDSDSLTVNYNLALIYHQLGDEQRAAEHQRLHERYRPDDNARDRAIAIERRRNPAANHAAQATVIYSLQRPGAPGLAQNAAQTAERGLQPASTHGDQAVLKNSAISELRGSKRPEGRAPSPTR